MKELQNFHKIYIEILKSKKVIDKEILKRFAISDHSYSMMFSELLSKHKII